MNKRWIMSNYFDYFNWLLIKLTFLLFLMFAGMALKWERPCCFSLQPQRIHIHCVALTFLTSTHILYAVCCHFNPAIDLIITHLGIKNFLSWVLFSCGESCSSAYKQSSSSLRSWHTYQDTLFLVPSCSCNMGNTTTGTSPLPRFSLGWKYTGVRQHNSSSSNAGCY